MRDSKKFTQASDNGIILTVERIWPALGKRVGKEERTYMSVENTQQTMEAYLQDLVGGGPYKRHFADDVLVALVGTDQGAEGPDAAEEWINYLHRQAFEARPELKNMFVAEGKAAVEVDFVGKHVGEFNGIAATGREVRVPYSVVYDLEGEKIKVV